MEERRADILRVTLRAALVSLAVGMLKGTVSSKGGRFAVGFALPGKLRMAKRLTKQTVFVINLDEGISFLRLSDEVLHCNHRVSFSDCPSRVMCTPRRLAAPADA